MNRTSTSEQPTRPKWEIDERLERMISHDIRVAAESFSPVRWNGEAVPMLVPVRSLILPDNTQVGVLPVFFEGRLRQFERRIGVVCVSLDAPTLVEASVEGVVAYRGAAAVVVRGPATVCLAYPFRVERLPQDPDNYWEDVRIVAAQFRLPFP